MTEDTLFWRFDLLNFILVGVGMGEILMWRVVDQREVFDFYTFVSWIVVIILILGIFKYFSTLAFKLVARVDGGSKEGGRGVDGRSTKKCTPRRWVSGGMPKYCFTCYIKFWRPPRLFSSHPGFICHSFHAQELDITERRQEIIFCWVMQVAVHGGGGGGRRGVKWRLVNLLKVAQSKGWRA